MDAPKVNSSCHWSPSPSNIVIFYSCCNVFKNSNHVWLFPITQATSALLIVNFICFKSISNSFINMKQLANTYYEYTLTHWHLYVSRLGVFHFNKHILYFLRLSQCTPIHPSKHPLLHVPLIWLQDSLSLQCPVHWCDASHPVISRWTRYVTNYV